MSIFFYKSYFKNPLKNPTSYLVEAEIEVGFWEVGFSQKPASTKYEVGFLSGILKVGFVEKYGLIQIQCPRLLHLSDNNI